MTEEGAKSFYDELLELWRSERSCENLAKMPEDFKERVYAYASRLRQLLKVLDKKSLTFTLKSAELESVKRLVSSLLEMRLRKILSMLMLGVEPENMLDMEKELVLSISKAIHGYMQRIKSISHDLKVPATVDVDAKYELICFMQDFPKIVGEDLRSYGPFKQFDIATLPTQNALAMMSRKVVKPITIF